MTSESSQEEEEEEAKTPSACTQERRGSQSCRGRVVCGNRV